MPNDGMHQSAALSIVSRSQVTTGSPGSSPTHALHMAMILAWAPLNQPMTQNTSLRRLADPQECNMVRSLNIVLPGPCCRLLRPSACYCTDESTLPPYLFHASLPAGVLRLQPNYRGRPVWAAMTTGGSLVKGHDHRQDHLSI